MDTGGAYHPEADEIINIDAVMPISSIEGIKDAVFWVRQQIDFEHPLELAILKSIGKKGLESSVYHRSLALFPYNFIMNNPYKVQKIIYDCLTTLQLFWDKVSGTDKFESNFEKFYQYGVIRGALVKLYSMIDPFTSKILVKSKDSTHLLKIFSAIDTNLASVSSDELDQAPNSPQKVGNLFVKLSPKDRELLVTSNWNPQFINSIDLKRAKKTLEYLMVDEEVSLFEPPQLVSIFLKMDESKRMSFIKMILPQLMIKEKQFLEKSIVGG